ncbi:MAG TPA: ABC transporter substrate-binding protein [Rhodopila sp.]|uniref:ABC transporter substrate-binding protein n=1 Tax=Rhodopila sp. TaxID=2480087 RepID=UPI002D1049D3|nr:ABC transporter substrate-binding protein [Rhodopila sp.]HVY16139.1 ABC transporter substrate-binding protein [Rhodopila sp.]
MILSRRTLVGGAAALSVAPTIGARAQAKTQGRTKIVIGVMTDLSGTYRDNTGPTSLAATQLAVNEMRPHLDCDIEVISADHQNKPDVAVSIARQWFDSGVDVAADVPTSSVALAVAQVAKEKDKIMLNASATVSSLTDEQCSPNSIVWSFDTYENARSTGGSLVSQGFKSWYFITANYAFGQSLETLTADVVRAGGGEVKGATRYPFPDTTDFSSYLTQAAASGASVVAFANAGLDTENCIKQASEFGLNKTARLAPLLMFLQNPHSLGPRICGGLLTTETFYWDMNDRTRGFTKRLLALTKTNNYPNQAHASSYGSTIHYMKAVAALGGEAAKKSGRAVVAKMKSMPTDDDAFGPGRVRADGRGEFPAYLFQVKTPEESKGEWDLYKLVRTTPASEVVHPLNAKCKFPVT